MLSASLFVRGCIPTVPQDSSIRNIRCQLKASAKPSHHGSDVRMLELSMPTNGTSAASREVTQISSKSHVDIIEEIHVDQKPSDTLATAPSDVVRGNVKHAYAPEKRRLSMKTRVNTDRIVREAANQGLQALQSRGKGSIIGDIESVDSRGVDWSQTKYNKQLRSVKIWLYAIDLRLSLFLLDQKWTYLGGGFTSERRGERATVIASRLRDTALQLGPTFIKVGQLFSSRSDIVSKEFVEELSKLQDRVPSFGATRALQLIEQELGAEVTTLFKEFHVEPLAAASLGQVHKATLWDGRTVAVKLQRPGLKELFEIDLEALRQIAVALDKQDERRDLESIYQECSDVLFQEIDYLLESSMAVLDAVESVELSFRGVPSTCRRHGFFHADPHPGNVAVQSNNGNPVLVYYDFGMMGEIKANIRENLLELFYGVYRKNPDQVLDALVTMGVLKLKAGDRISLRRTISFFIENLSQQAEREATLQAIGEDVFAIAADQPLRFPATFTFVLRAFTTLEGVSKGLDPDYNFASMARPYVSELLDLDQATSGRQAALALQQQLTTYSQATAAVPNRVEYLETTLRKMEEGDLKLRVRVMESERAARRQAVVQDTQLNAVILFGTLNLGTTFSLQGLSLPSTGCWALCAICSLLIARGYWRVKRLDKFERDVTG